METKDSRRPGVKLGALFIAAFALDPAAHAAGPRADFNIPAGDARSTLLQFYVQSGVQVLYLAEAVENVSTRAVAGSLEASDALARLLESTGLVFEFESPTSAVVRTAAPPSGGFSPGSVTDSASATPTGVTLAHSFTPPGVYGSGPKDISEVTVTGTLIRGVLDLMSPLQVIDRTEIKQAAYATVQDIMQTLPVNFGAPQSEDFGGSGNFGRGSALNLRGLGAGATLVLVNGRRQTQAGIQADFVDVSAIPWSTVERIEVLPDGTSALYGSDAIAGVVNIIMRNSLEGAESHLRVGTAAGGGQETTAAQLFGHRWDTGRALFSYQFYERTALAAADRAYAADSDKTAFGGSNYRSFRSNPGNILNPATLLPAFAIPAGQDGTDLEPSDLLPGMANLQNKFESQLLLPDKQIHTVFFHAAQAIGERVEMFAEGRASSRHVDWRTPAEERLLVVPATNPFFVDPFGGSPFVIVSYSFKDDLGPVTGSGRTFGYTATTGLKGDLGAGWGATLSASYGREELDWTAYNLLDPSGAKLNAALRDSDPATAFNPFGAGASTNPATLASIRSTQRSKAASGILTAGLVADGPVLDLPAGRLRAAAGVESTHETLDRTLIGRDLAYTPQRYHRQIVAAFTELSAPLMGDPDNAREPPRLELSLAGRYEEYSDFGRTFNPKVGLRWAPLGSVKLRASWGTSFKAPRLVDLYDVSQNLAGLVVLPDSSHPAKQSLALVLQGSNEKLSEETATSWTLGADFAPQATPGLTLSVTGFDIDYRDQVIQPGNPSPFDILNHGQRWAAIITRSPSRTQIDEICNSRYFLGPPSQCTAASPAVIVDVRLRNLASTRVRGVDLRLGYARDTPVGGFTLNLTGNYFFDFLQAVTRTSAPVDIANSVGSPPGLRMHGSLQWHRHSGGQSGLSANLSADHTGGYRNGNSARMTKVDAWTTMNLQISYNIGKGHGWWENTRLGVNASNIFDQAPPFVDSDYGYDPVNTEPLGRVLSFQVEKNWGGR